MSKVILECDHVGCQNKREIERDHLMPKGTESVTHPCAEHSPEGGFSESRYFDENGTELFNA